MYIRKILKQSILILLGMFTRMVSFNMFQHTAMWSVARSVNVIMVGTCWPHMYVTSCRCCAGETLSRLAVLCLHPVMIYHLTGVLKERTANTFEPVLFYVFFFIARPDSSWHSLRRGLHIVHLASASNITLNSLLYDSSLGECEGFRDGQTTFTLNL